MADSQGDGGTARARGSPVHGPRRARARARPRPPRRPRLHHPHQVPDRRRRRHRRRHDAPRSSCPVVGFAAADALKEEEWQWVDIGPLSDFPDGKTTSIAVSGPRPESDRRAYVRHKDSAIIAIWNRCAHLGCPVAYSAGGDVYACPCHGGAYDSLGLVTSGPPPRPLDRFDVKIVDADGKDVAAAGGPADGLPDAERQARRPPAPRPAVLDRRRPEAVQAQAVPVSP